MAKQTAAAEEMLDRISLMCLDALNQATSMKDYEAWVSRIFAIANPDDADPDADDLNDE